MLVSSTDKDLVFVGSNLVIDGELIQLGTEKLIAGFRLNGVIAVISEKSFLLVSKFINTCSSSQTHTVSFLLDNFPGIKIF